MKNLMLIATMVMILIVCSIEASARSFSDDRFMSFNKQNRHPIDAKIDKYKEQIKKLLAQKMADTTDVTYKDSLKIVKKYKVEVLKNNEIIVDHEENSRMKIVYSTMKRVYDKYNERKKIIESNSNIETFAAQPNGSYKVQQVLGEGYYIVSNTRGTKMSRLYAPNLNMVDDDRVPDIYVVRQGIYQYITVLGAKKTVNSYLMIAYHY